jgi:mycothiol synthase
MEIIRPKDMAERRRALALLLSRPELTQSELDHNIDHLIRYVQKSNLSVDECLVARQNGQNVAACLCIDSPGRTASVFIPDASRLPRITPEVLALLEHAATQAEQRRIRLMQAMLASDAKHEATIFRQAGFNLIAQLIFMENDLLRPLPPARLPVSTVNWITYSQDTHSMFAKTIEGSYIESLDCGSLNGLRDIEDILASHRAVGQFEPKLWFLAQIGGEPVGVILLAYLPDRWSFELVYMGLLKDWRGRGYGTALLAHGLEVAQARAGSAFALTVDIRNQPAIGLYQRFGFKEISRRDAWIKILPEAFDVNV